MKAWFLLLLGIFGLIYGQYQAHERFAKGVAKTFDSTMLDLLKDRVITPEQATTTEKYFAERLQDNFKWMNVTVK